MGQKIPAAGSSNTAKAKAWLNEALALHETGEFSQAQKLYEAVLAVDAKNINALTNLGLLHWQQGRAEECVRYSEKSLALYPNQPRTLVDIGDALRALNRAEDALKSYGRAIALDANLAEAHYGRAVILHQYERNDEALTSAARAIALQPALGDAHNIHGSILHKLGRHAEALASYDAALALHPDAAIVLNNKAAAFLALKRGAEALACSERALAQDATVAIYHNSRGNALELLKRHDEALASYDRAIALDPRYAKAHNNRALTLYQLGRFDEALASVNHALAFNPHYADAHWGKALILLMRGDYLPGWAAYEWRWKTEQFIPTMRDLPQPLWLGKTPVAGKTILIYPEQGIGDFLQFCRYVPLLEATGANIVLETHPALTALMASLSPSVTIISRGHPLPPCDLRCPIMSLPHAFGTTLDTIPNQTPYLSAPPEKCDVWKNKMGSQTPSKTLRVGLVWSGGTLHQNDAARSIALATFKPLFALPFEFHSLQKEIRAADEATLATLPNLHRHETELEDFADTAALIAQLDLVITVDTSVAHLAGALGKPVWLLLTHVPDFRWLLGRDDSPWYPTARLFRQPTPGDWASVIAQVTETLAGGTVTSAPTNPVAAPKSRALALSDSRQFAEALAHYEQALALDPKDAELHLHYGMALRELGRFEGALASYDRAIVLAPTLALAHERRAMAMVKLERYEDAIVSCEQALALQPRAANVYNILGRAQQQLQRYADALASYDMALSLAPNAADIYSARAAMLVQLRREEEALASYDRAIALVPNDVSFYNNRGRLRHEMGRFDAAMADYNHALTLQPNLADVEWNKALLLLLFGDFSEGWKLHEARWKSTGLKKQNMRYPAEPLWLGETPVAGKTLLIHPEQGFGDFIQFCRYVPLLEAIGAHVILETPPSLMPLIATLKGGFTIVEKGGALPPIDMHCPIMSLPLAMRTQLATIPNPGPYFSADPAKSADWQQRLGKKSRPRVGLAWSGSPTHGNDRNRSIALAQLAPLLQSPCEFHSLQKETRTADEAALATLPTIHRHEQYIADFADTAALIDAMDVVITVDTSIAHLAGALGKPVWLLLPYIPDFRWLLDRDDSPWYSTARLFRQPASDDWESVIAQMTAALKTLH